MRAISTGVAGSFGLLIVIGAAQGQPRNAREALEQAHEGVRFHEVGGRPRIVYGVPMTEAATPEAAAEAWLALYGEVFIDGREAGGPDLQQFAEFKTVSGKTILAYSQFVDGIPVEQSNVRLVAVEAGAQWRIAFASARVALRPVGGLPEPQVTANEALVAAQAHEAGLMLEHWRTPGYVAIYENPPAGSGEAWPVWKCVGAADHDSRTFYVDAISGEVLSHFSNISHGMAPDITGNVTGKVSPGTKPDRTNDDTCDNPPVVQDVVDVKVVALNSSQVQIAETFTDENGDYVLDVPNSTAVTVVATAWNGGEAWIIMDMEGASPGYPPNCPTLGTTLSASTSATAPASGVDLQLNSSPSQHGTAELNTANHLSKTRRYVGDRVPGASRPLSGLDEIVRVWVNINGSPACNAKWQRDGFNCNGEFGVLVFTISQAGECINSGYSTWVSHEYGHYLLEEMLNIMNGAGLLGFHEGFADALAFLAQDTEIFGEDSLEDGDVVCGLHIREPLLDDPDFPHCSSSQHVRGELLGALWLDLRNSTLGLSTTRQLHVDWMFLCDAPGFIQGVCGGTQDPSAAESTLIEVLTADDDDGNLNNGTPNDDVICGVFSDRLITTGVCPERSAHPCPADCDRSTGRGVLDVFDFLCFQNRFSAGDPRACDCDLSTGPAVCDVFDYLCFQAAFAEGCP